MAVHVPLSPKTRAESLTLLWSRNHVLAPASGQPLLLPTQDMVLGFYYLTCSQENFQQDSSKNETISSPSEIAQLGNKKSGLPGPKFEKFVKKNKNWKENEYFIPSHQALIQTQNLQKRTALETFGQSKERFFSSFSEVKQSYDRGFLKLHSLVWVKWPGFVQTFVSEQHAHTKENVIETRVNLFGKIENVFFETVLISSETPILAFRAQYVRTTVGRILMHSWIFENNSRSIS